MLLTSKHSHIPSTPHTPEFSSCTKISTGSMHRGRRSEATPKTLPPPASGCGKGVKGQVCRLAAEMGCTPTTLRAVPSMPLSCFPSLSAVKGGKVTRQELERRRPHRNASEKESWHIMTDRRQEEVARNIT